MIWPPNYVAEFARRARLIKRLRANPALIGPANAYYADNLRAYIHDWGITVDPRNAKPGSEIPAHLPFVTFERQDDFIDFLLACLNAEANGLVEKSRDMGATWICVGASVWLWRYWKGSATGWGSRKEDLVDKLGDMDSIFEKIRTFIRYLPRELLPNGFNFREHSAFMRLINPENGATITGESGDNIGRGGRKLIYFKDESCWYEHPEMIEASLGDNTNVQIDISSVHGLGNVFHRKREAGIEWLKGQPALKGETNVFVMDWSDHPAKDQAWHDQRKAEAKKNGLLHVFASEVDRDYAAAVEGVIIPAEWVSAAIDAHLKLDYLGDWDSGLWGAGLDVADEGLDRNALVTRKGSILKTAEEWGERDTGVTTRKVVQSLMDKTPIEVQYDCIGVGSGVKSEMNRLKDEKAWPKHLELIAWNAGREVLYPNELVVPRLEGDEDNSGSPKNKDFYTNIKAQAWWELRRRFEKTYRAVYEGEYFNIDELISIDSTIPLLRSLQKELSQPTAGPGARLKMVVNKMPKGAKSPNLGDGAVMCFWPIPQNINQGQAVFGTYGLGAGRV